MRRLSLFDFVLDSNHEPYGRYRGPSNALDRGESGGTCERHEFKMGCPTVSAFFCALVIVMAPPSPVVSPSMSNHG